MGLMAQQVATSPSVCKSGIQVGEREVFCKHSF